MRYLQLLAVLLLAAAFAVGQDYPSPSQSTPASTGDEQSVQGCLSGSDGNYTLMVKDGTSFRLTGDTAKLAQHIGHEIQVTGTINSAALSQNNDISTSTTGEPMPSAPKEIQITSVRHIAKTCAMSH